MPEQPWLSIVLPTSARRHAELFRTLESIQQQKVAGVEVVVVADTYATTDRARFDLLRDEVVDLRAGTRWLEHDGGLNCWGQPQRSFGARQSRGDWVAFTQDDNILAQNAINTIALALKQEPRKRPLFFRVLTAWREPVWRTPHLVISNIDADCLVLPHAIAEQVTWGLRYEGDFDAAVQASSLAGGDVGWRDETIAIARPDLEHVWWQ
jgi:glycosyltransferase involved in cell wall biosynthesis